MRHMVDEPRQPSRHVGHRRDREDAHRRMPRDEHLGHRAHADGIRAPAPEHAQLRRRLEVRTGDGHVHALAQILVDLMREPAELLGVGADHIRETRTERVVVRAAEWVAGHEVDVVADDHEVAGFVRRIQSPARVRKDDRLDPPRLEDAHRERDLLHVVALVVVQASLHDRDGLALEPADDELARVTQHGAALPSGDALVRDAIGVLHILRERAQAASEDDRDRRTMLGERADRGDRGLRVESHSPDLLVTRPVLSGSSVARDRGTAARERSARASSRSSVGAPRRDPHRALLQLIAARGDVTERGVELLRGRDREEAEMADVHAEQRHAVGRERASGVEHRAVAAEYACDVEAVELRVLHVVEAHLADAVTERLDALRRDSRLVHRALEARARADRDLHSAARRAASYKTKSSGGAAPRRACTKISRLPSRPARREGATAMTGTRASASASATLTTAFARSAGSRTIPPRPTASRPASNWGFTSATMSPSSRRCRSDGRSTRRSEMNETSATMRSTVSGRSTPPRAFTPSITTTRGSWRSFQSSWPFPTSTA